MNSRVRAALTAVLFCSLASGLSAQVRLGRVVWTQRASNQFTVRTKLFVPDFSLNELFRDGPLKVDQDHLMLVTENEVDASVSTRDLSADGVLDINTPKSTLRFLHPTLDYTGKRVVFASGETWGPGLTASALGQVSGGPALYYGYDEDARRFTDPPGSGAGYDAFPVMDPAGRYVFFSRFLYRTDNGDKPGWYLMKTSRADAEAAREGEESYLEDDAGTRVQGYQPTLDSTGQYLFFLRQDPLNIGTDIWYGRLDASGSDWVLTDVDLLVHGEGDSPPSLVPAQDRDNWVLHEIGEGRARLSRPTLDASGKIIAYAADRDGDWDIYTRPIQVAADGSLSVGTETRVMPSSDADEADDSWPSLSSDGRFVAFMSNRDDSGNRLPGGRTRIWTAGVEAGGGPAGSPELVEDTADEQLWPAWEQDDDPPHLLIVLHTHGGAEPTKIQIQDQNPDPIPDPSNASAPPMDVASLAIHLADYYPDAPPPGEGTGLPPIHFGFGADSASSPERVNLRYQLTGPSAAADVGYNPFTSSDDDRGHGMHLLFSAKRDDLGLHRTFKGGPGLEVEDPNGGSGPGTAANLSDAQFDGMYLFENQRLGVSVYARDNRWLRIGPTSDVDALYSDDFLIEETQLEPRDPRSLPEGPARPPYLSKRAPEEIMGPKKFPGIAWWIEEGPRDGTDERDLDPPRHKNAPFIIFRFANYPPEQYAGDSSRNKDIYLRVVARDLLGNLTDVRVPLHIRGKDFQVNSINRGGQRGR